MEKLSLIHLVCQPLVKEERPPLLLLRAVCTSDQIFSGVSGMSMVLIPSGARASRTALTMAGGAPIQPASPTPLAPSGLRGEGVSMMSVTEVGTCSAFGKA